MKLDYDYIICGAGGSGLSLAFRLAHEEFHKYKVLLIDKADKQTDDRTWSIWTKGDGPFDHLAEKSWNKILFRNDEIEKEMEIAPYRYIKIKGIDFYNFTLDKIRSAPNITFLQDEIAEIDVRSQSPSVKTTMSGEFKAKWIFNSILRVDIDKSKYNYVDQHFKGWFIKTDTKAFNPEVATFMDFSIDQKGECRFMYVLPTSTREALVEIAIFSNNILEQSAYDEILEKYINDDLKISSYDIEDKEFAIIPMTTYPFERANKPGITYIGTAGAAAKGSTGYAFLHIQDQVDLLISKIRDGKEPTIPNSFYDNKYRWYDNVLLNVLLKNRMPIGKVFGDMFKKLPTPLMLKFLSNKTTLLEDLRILSTPKYLPFIKAALNEFWKTK